MLRNFSALVLLVSAYFSLAVDGHRILVAGDYDKDRRGWFDGVAKRLSTNEKTENQVYFLTPELPIGQEEAISDRFIRLGIGSKENNEGSIFKWNMAATEE